MSGRPLTLDLELLRTLRAVARTGSFTAAATQLHRTQSAVSMQIKRLEELTGKRLLLRNNQGLQFTRDGERLLDHAARMLKLNDEAVQSLGGSALTGSVRLGTPADYATTLLSGVLPFFAETFPGLEIEVRYDLSPGLLRALDAGELDLALVTRGDTEDTGGEQVWREDLVWVTARHELVHEANPLPLAVFPEGCFYRLAAIEALKRIGRDHRIAYTSPSLAGIHVAVEAGFAVSVVGRNAVTGDMRVLGRDEGFPALPGTEIMLHCAEVGANTPASRIAEYILTHLRRQVSGTGRPAAVTTG